MPIEPNLREEDINIRVPITESEVVKRGTGATEQAEGKVEVIQPSVVMAVEVTVSASDEDTSTVELHLTPSEARELSSGLQNADTNGESPELVRDLIEHFPQTTTDSLTKELQMAADVASGASLTEEFGNNMIDMYDKGLLTVSDLLDEFGERTQEYQEELARR